MKINSGAILASTVALATTLSASAKSQKSSDKPNVIIIFCDDLGYGDLGCFGHPTIKTPHLDKMASEGQKWSSFYVSASVSSPSRAGLLTGRMNVRTGLYGSKRRVLFPNSTYGLPQEEITIAELLKESGYTTACIGKWHLGHKPENMPLANGFDYFYGSPFSNDMSRKEQSKVGNNNYPYEYVIYDQDKIVETEPDQTDLTKKINQRAIDFIKENKKEPFFLYLTHPMPHWPVYASQEFQGTSARGPYGDCIEELDSSVGEIIETLKESGLEDNTLVVFTSDNGPWLTYKSMGGSAGHLNEGKAAVLDGGFRVPCIMWGSMVEHAHITDMGSTLDLLPTICELTGTELPSDRVYDGSSLMGVLERVESSPRNDFFYYRNGFLYALRRGDYKILFAYQSGYGGDPRVIYEEPKLFNIAQDPEERYNIADENPALIKELTAYAQKHKEEVEIKPALFDAVE